MVYSGIKKILKQLKKNEITVFDVPEEYENDIQIVTFERRARLRITGKKALILSPIPFLLKKL